MAVSVVGSRLIMSSVLIADDHAVVRAGYRQFLGTEPNITRIGEAADGAEVIRRLQCELWDLVMLDIHMPDRSGLDVLHHIRVEHPAVRVLIVSGLREDQYARNVLRAGASGYVSKGDAPEDMMLAVRTVLSGRRYVSRTLAELLVSDLDGAADEPLHTRLSSREFQIFCKIAAGVGVSKIAQELSLSVKTISTYRSRIMEKLTFNSNADMTAYALRNELIQ